MMNELRLNRKIYTVSAVEKTVVAFQKIVKMKIKVCEDETMVYFSDFLLDPELTLKEFENYLIAEENAL